MSKGLMPFGAWLRRQTGRADMIGDLAGDFVLASDHRELTSVRAVLNHMRHRGATEPAYLAFDAAVEEWSDSDCPDADWGAFLEAVRGTFGDEPWTAPELVARVGDAIPAETLPRTGLMERLTNHGEDALAAVVQRWLKHRKGTVYGGLCVMLNYSQTLPGSHHIRDGAILWRVETV